MRKDRYPKQKVELVFETSKLKSNGEPLVITAHNVPKEYAEAIPRFFDMSGDGEIIIDEEAYNSRLRGIRKNNPDAKDYLGWVHHKLGPNLGKSGIWGCKLVGQYSTLDKNPQRSLFYDDQSEAEVVKLETKSDKQTAKTSSEEIVIEETWNTKDGKFKPRARRVLVAITNDGEFIASREMPEDFSGEARSALEQEAEAILARKKAA